MNTSNTGSDNVYFKALEFTHNAIYTLLVGQLASPGDSSGMSNGTAQSEVRKKLETVFEVFAGDGRKVVMDQAILDHWMVGTGKLESDIESRLACLDYAIETLLHPTERWDQDIQSRYLKKFQKVTGGYEGCMVVVTNNGKCRTYFLPNVTKIDKSRIGKSYEVIAGVESSTGRSTTQTTSTVAAPGSTDDRNDDITP